MKYGQNKLFYDITLFWSASCTKMNEKIGHISQKKPNALKFPKMYNFCFVLKNRPEVKKRTFPTILFKLSALIHNIISHHSWNLSLYLAHQVSYMVQNIDNTSANIYTIQWQEMRQEKINCFFRTFKLQKKMLDTN